MHLTDAPAPPSGPGRADVALLDRVDAALRAVRRAAAPMLGSSLVVPALGRSVEVAKLAACLGVAELNRRSPGTPVTVKDLAGTLQLEPSTVSRILTEAAGEGLVRRGRDSADRRRRSIELTPAGVAAADYTEGARRRMAECVLQDWSTEQIQTLAALLERLAVDLAANLAHHPSR